MFFKKIFVQALPIEPAKGVLMEYKISENKIELLSDDGAAIAELDFPYYRGSSRTVEITHTYVHESLRGQGIAGIMMDKLIEELIRTGRRARPVCSYAVKWLEKHPEHQELISNENE